MDLFKLGEMIGELRGEVKNVSETQTEILSKFGGLSCADHNDRIQKIETQEETQKIQDEDKKIRRRAVFKNMPNYIKVLWPIGLLVGAAVLAAVRG